MKYLYLYLWTGVASLTFNVFSKILIPINLLIIKLWKKSDLDYEVWKQNYNKTKFDFPEGINGWYTFGLMMSFFYFPILFLIINLNINIEKNKVFIIGVFILITILCYYLIYIKSEKWLKEKINKEKEKYFFK